MHTDIQIDEATVNYPDYAPPISDWLAKEVAVWIRDQFALPVTVQLVPEGMDREGRVSEGPLG